MNLKEHRDIYLCERGFYFFLILSVIIHCLSMVSKKKGIEEEKIDYVLKQLFKK